MQEAELGGDPHVADHGAADEGDLAPGLLSRVEDLLDPVDVAAEAGDDDAPFGMPEDLVDGRRDLELRGGEAGHVGVRRVGEEQVDTLLPQPGEGTQIGDPTIERQLVHLEVTGVEQGPGLGAHEHRERVRNGVVHRHELEVEGADPLALPLRDGQGERPDAVLLELGLDERQRQGGADEGNVLLEAEQVRNGTDVVLVSVREDDGLDVVETVLEV